MNDWFMSRNLRRLGIYCTYFLLVFEADLTDRHTTVLLQIRPGCIDDCNIILFISLIANSNISVPYYNKETKHNIQIYVYTIEREREREREIEYGDGEPTNLRLNSLWSAAHNRSAASGQWRPRSRRREGGGRCVRLIMRRRGTWDSTLVLFIQTLNTSILIQCTRGCTNMIEHTLDPC